MKIGEFRQVHTYTRVTGHPGYWLGWQLQPSPKTMIDSAELVVGGRSLPLNRVRGSEQRRGC